MATVTLSHVFKRYGPKTASVTAVRDLNLAIREKEFMVFVGPSGCGKTTALRMLAGLEEISDGTVAINGTVVNHVEPRDRDIAMVFQNYALYPHMSVYDNMAFALKLRRVAPADIRHRVQNAARLLDLEPYLKRKPGALSGGQRQRVALGRAIVREPKVFLMDEPLSNLDAKLRVQTRAEIIKLHRRLGITTVYVTHDQVEAMTMGDRIAVMKEGVLQQCDTPMEIYRRPANMFVAGFIGMPPMNFLDGVLEKDEQGYYVDLGAFRTPISTKSKSKLDAYLNRKVIVGLRPSDIKTQGNGRGLEAASCCVIPAMVDVLEPMGDVTTLYATATGAGERQQKLIAQVDGAAKVTEGRTLDLVFSPDTLHLFDPETELSLL